jgi:hypothetical protein
MQQDFIHIYIIQRRAAPTTSCVIILIALTAYTLTHPPTHRPTTTIIKSTWLAEYNVEWRKERHVLGAPLFSSFLSIYTREEISQGVKRNYGAGCSGADVFFLGHGLTSSGRGAGLMAA